MHNVNAGQPVKKQSYTDKKTDRQRNRIVESSQITSGTIEKVIRGTDKVVTK